MLPKVFFHAGVLLLKRSQLHDLLDLPRKALLPREVIRRLRHLAQETLRHSLGLRNQPLGRFELVDDLLGCMRGSFHARLPGLTWTGEDDHST